LAGCRAERSRRILSSRRPPRGVIRFVQLHIDYRDDLISAVLALLALAPWETAPLAQM